MASSEPWSSEDDPPLDELSLRVLTSISAEMADCKPYLVVEVDHQYCRCYTTGLLQCHLYPGRPIVHTRSFEPNAVSQDSVNTLRHNKAIRRAALQFQKSICTHLLLQIGDFIPQPDLPPHAECARRSIQVVPILNRQQAHNIRTIEVSSTFGFTIPMANFVNLTRLTLGSGPWWLSAQRWLHLERLPTASDPDHPVDGDDEIPPLLRPHEMRDCLVWARLLPTSQNSRLQTYPNMVSPLNLIHHPDLPHNCEVRVVYQLRFHLTRTIPTFTADVTFDVIAGVVISIDWRPTHQANQPDIGPDQRPMLENHWLW